ncbi:MAG: translocation/assembly module TamB domain-containing protein [Chthoniobacterales bacterium]
MDENGNASKSAWRVWLKRVGIAFGIIVLVLVVFHRPILQTIGRRVAIHFAAQQNLKVDFRLEGSVVGGLTLRNVHVAATGPSALQSADIDLVRVDYSLWNWMTKGMADLLQNVEVRSASIVLDPAKAPPEIKLPKNDEKFALPAFFPNRLVLDDVNLRYVSTPKDLVIEHLNLELNPRQPGALRIAKLQLSSGRAWTEIVATTSYENRNLILHDLVLDEKTKLRLVNVDASRLAENALDLKVEGELVGAKIATTISLGEKKDAMAARIDLVAEDLSLETLTAYIAPPKIRGTNVDGPKVELDTTRPALRGDVKRIAIKLDGELERPSSWNGTVVGQMENIAAGGVVFDSAAIDFRAADGVGTIKNIELKQGPSTITVRGTAALPDTLDGFGRSPATIELRGMAPDLAAMTAGMSPPIKGAAEFSGRVHVRKDANVELDFNLAAGPIDFGTGTVERAIVNLRATKIMPPPEVERPYFEGLTSEIGLEMTEVRAKDYAIDAVAGKIRTDGQNVMVDEMLVNRRNNRLTLRGTYLLPMDFSLAAGQPAVLDVSLAASEVGDYWANAEAPDRVTGALQLSVRVDYREGLRDGVFSISGSDLRAKNLLIEQLSGSGTTADNVVHLTDLTARLNERDTISAQGTSGIKEPYAYTGKLAVNVADLSTFESILRATGNQAKLAGKLAIDWEGSGAISTLKNTGKLKLTLEKGRFADLDKLEATIDANYSPEELNVPIVYVSSDKMMFQAIMQAKGSTLEVTRIQIDQGTAKFAAGYLAVPFVWEHVGTDKPLFPSDGKVLVNIQTENLDIQKLAKDLGTTAPVSGAANIKLEAQGTIDDLNATFELQLSALRSDGLKGFEPATFDVKAKLEKNQLAVDGKLVQARIAPVQINATLPFDVAKIIAEKKLDENTPVKATVRMPSSSINFVRQFAPALQRVDGNLALDLNVDGTIAKPTLSGSADMRINSARFTSASLPAVTNFTARLVFAQDRLDFEQFKGELAGGPFTLSGRITFPKLTEPNFDLQLRADAILVARNDDLTARTDANLSIKGPLASAAVTGTVAITNSKFLKNIDLIPIGVPGRPPPAPAPPSDTPDLSFPEPPLRDWTFNVAITTKDPFLIRGNLAKGGAIVNMTLTGTGLKPLLNGSVRLQNVEATLPFSRLEIDQGFITFNPDDPFNPNLDLRGSSLIRDYTVQVLIYGTADAPEVVFSSQPPLPQEDIITLLATGVTREQLASGGNVLAGRALILLGKSLYQEVFKKGKSDSNTTSAFDRLDVEAGGVDPRTGQQTATARFRATDQIQLIGEIGVQGDFRGTVKYVVRFR